jgi:low temperature requirement protein LtrA
MASRMLTAGTTAEGHRATPVELFFDVVYVFGFTQVTHLMTESAGPIGVLQGLAVFGVLWWSWASYAWLANQVHTGYGLGRAGILGAVVLVFVTSLAIPAAFPEHPAGLAGPMLFVAGFIGFTLTYTVVTVLAAAADPALRRQAIVTMGVTIVPVSAALVTGVLVGGVAQLVLWLTAVVIEGVTVWLTSHGGVWRVPSATHYAERHQLVIILALGESVISIGTGASGHPLGAGVVTGAVLAVALAIAMWWIYFHDLATAARAAVASRDGASRAALATSGTYLHAGIVAGILIVASGLEKAMENVEAAHALGWFGAATIGAGLAGYLATTTAYRWRMTGRLTRAGVIAALLAVLCVPGLAALPVPVALLTVVVLCLIPAWRREGFTPAAGYSPPAPEAHPAR